MVAVFLGRSGSVRSRLRFDKVVAAVGAWSQLLLREIYVAIGLATTWFFACILCLIHSLKTSAPQTQTRNQVKWILTGALLATGPICYALFLALTRPDQFGLGGAIWPMFFASLSISLAYAVSISRYGLMEVRDVLNLSILSLGASVAAGLVYTGIVFLGMFFLDSHFIDRGRSIARRAEEVSSRIERPAWKLSAINLALDFLAQLIRFQKSALLTVFQNRKRSSFHLVRFRRPGHLVNRTFGELAPARTRRFDGAHDADDPFSFSGRAGHDHAIGSGLAQLNFQRVAITHRFAQSSIATIVAQITKELRMDLLLKRHSYIPAVIVFVWLIDATNPLEATNCHISSSP